MAKSPKVESDDRLLVTRREAAHMLSCSKMSVMRLEWDGKLKPVRLRQGRAAITRYRMRDVRALAQAS